jgi:hypothetical protein
MTEEGLPSSTLCTGCRERIGKIADFGIRDRRDVTQGKALTDLGYV